MRLRRWLTLSAGASAGAAAMYLLDPDHGPARRRVARQQVLRQARSGAAATLVEARRRSGEIATAAVAGYQQSRQVPPRSTPGSTHPPKPDATSDPTRGAPR